MANDDDFFEFMKKAPIYQPGQLWETPPGVMDSKPTWQTIGDLVARCPGCGGTVSEGFTQDPFREIGKKRVPVYNATPEELKLLQGMFGSDVVAAWSVGTKIPTIRTTIGKVMWHEPCYLFAYAREQQKSVQKIVDLLQWGINRGIFYE